MKVEGIREINILVRERKLLLHGQNLGQLGL